MQWSMIFTFFKARGLNVGKSLVEEDKLELAKKLEQAAKDKGVEFILPTDVIAADKFDESAETKVVPSGEIPDGWMVCSTLLKKYMAASLYSRCVRVGWLQLSQTELKWGRKKQKH